jgi:two-component system sensor histidine kinase BaeS
LAFVLVALSSVVVLTVAALIGTARGLSAGEDAQRASVAGAAANASGDAYRIAGGWAGADLSRAESIAESAGGALVVRDADGRSITTSTGMMQGGGMNGAARGGLTAPVVVDGATVGSVRLGFGGQSASTAQSIAWTWILIAAVVSLLVAVLVAWYVSGRISRPLVRLSLVARSFAAGDRAARATAEDSAAPGELGELARAFDATADDVVRAERTRQRMAADVAHELRTPLAALRAGLEELRDGLVEPDAARIAALHAQSVRLGRVVEDLGALAEAQAQSLTLRLGEVDLGAVAVDAVEAAQPSLEAAGVRVSRDIEPGILVEADADRIHQAIGNLLGNVARYCREGDDVTLTVRAESGRALLTVADTGPGIDQADLAHVFDRLWRGSADRDIAGSGIGLAVVREIVLAHGGDVAVESDGRAGATFTVTLPLRGRVGVIST